MSNQLIGVARLSIFKQAITLVGYLAIACGKNPVYAQIIPDNTLGNEGSVVSPDVEIKGEPGDRIDGGAVRGANLFHSFQQFNIGDGQRVYFANPTGIDNILSRVTGNNVSNILGTLGVNGSANLFLINPNGIIFGKNASLDVGGSFLGSSADSLLFPEGEFSATNMQKPLLTINAPIGLNFRDNPGDIVNSAKDPNLIDPDSGFPLGLKVESGKNIFLVGGNVSLEGGKLTAPAGRVNVGGLSTAGQVKFNENGSLSFPDQVAREDVSLSDKAVVNVAGTRGGNIFITADNIQINGNSGLLGGTYADGQLDSQSGDINLNATGVINLDTGSIDNGVQIGNAGNISIATGSLNMSNGALIATSTIGKGNAGNVKINANEIISVDGDKNGIFSSILSQVEKTGKGNSGGIDITTKNLSVTNGGSVSVSTFGEGNAGNVKINANETISVDGVKDGFLSTIVSRVNENGKGNAGGIDITTKNLSVTNGGQISASTFGEGNAGNVKINANKTIFVDGVKDDFLSTIASRVNDNGKGNAGGLDITTKNLSVTNGGFIDASTFGNGNVGNIKIKATSLNLDRGLIQSANEPLTHIQSSDEKIIPGGNINLNIKDLLHMRNQSLISAKASNNANGGNIIINAPNGFIVAFPNENSDITANALEGRGGNINIKTQGIFGIEPRDRLTPLNDITASSDFGISGVVNINTPDFDPSREQVELPSEVINIAGLINQNLCTVGEGSEFILTGRGGLPNSPKDLLNAEPSWEDWRITSEQIGSLPIDYTRSNLSKNVNNKPKKIVEAQGWKIAPNGKIILTAEPFGVTPENLRSRPLNCQTLREKP
jgi:filamentous hemagglutinin family protein